MSVHKERGSFPQIVKSYYKQKRPEFAGLVDNIEHAWRYPIAPRGAAKSSSTDQIVRMLLTFLDCRSYMVESRSIGPTRSG
jgi:hypothetical protein